MKHCNIPDVWNGEEALAFVAFLERLIDAVWRAHGLKMSRCLEKVHTQHHLQNANDRPSLDDPALFRYEPIPFPRR